MTTKFLQFPDHSRVPLLSSILRERDSVEVVDCVQQERQLFELLWSPSRYLFFIVFAIFACSDSQQLSVSTLACVQTKHHVFVWQCLSMKASQSIPCMMVGCLDLFGMRSQSLKAGSVIQREQNFCPYFLLFWPVGFPHLQMIPSLPCLFALILAIEWKSYPSDTYLQEHKQNTKIPMSSVVKWKPDQGAWCTQSFISQPSNLIGKFGIIGYVF